MRLSDLPSQLAAAREELADVPRELLGEIVRPRTLGITRASRVALRDEAWHLGVLLLSADALYATGEIVRSREPARRGYTAQSQRERADLTEAAYRGGILPGTPVHLGWRRLDPRAETDASAVDPLAVVDGEVRVRWSSVGGYVDLERYLAERVDLLRHPPAGAS